MKWIKADSLTVERLGYGWTKERPAPWDVGLLFAQGRLANGARLTVRELAASMGWSRRRGWECLKAAKEAHESFYPERDKRRDNKRKESPPLAPDSGTDPGHLTRARGVRSDSDPSEGDVAGSALRSRAREHAVRDDDLVTAEDWLLLRTGLRARRPIE
jgi:hypothetical protein